MNYYSQIKYENLPVVVLAGRPNVGKSTLFNRLTHRRRAITDPTPGVTRDPVSLDAFLGEKPVRLIDTGGFKLERTIIETGHDKNKIEQNNIDEIVVQRTLAQIQNADLIVLILAADDITGEDEEFIKLLRPLQDKVIVAVNKTEGGRLVSEAWNVLSYGFDNLHMISAEHGDNILELQNAILSRLDFSKVRQISNGAEDDKKRPVKISLAGKPNSGKSSLSNRLTSKEASIVSSFPGTTRDVIEGKFVWKGRDFCILDTAGIRRKTKVHQNIEYYSVNRAIKSFDDADIIILLLDATEGLTEQDKKIAGLACDKGKPVIFALNKWDLLPQIENTYTAMCDDIHFFFGKMEFAPIIAVSAKDGKGISDLLNTCIKMFTQSCKKISTSDFNASLVRWQLEYPPPSGPSTRFKIKYGLQTQVNPPKFKIFVSRKKSVLQSYITYITKKIRKDLGFSMIPITIDISSASKTKALH